MTAQEEWRPVVGYEGHYEVSNRGRVRSVPRLVPNNGGMQLRPGVILRPASSVGYPAVALNREGKSRTTKVHVLVLEAFVGPRPDGYHGCHYDDDKTNNSVENLRWGTPSSNGLDKSRNGRDRNRSRTHCKHGHPLSGRNLIWATEPRNGLPVRQCRTCVNRWRRTYREKRAARIAGATGGER